jgi:hypothetical protein
MQLGPANIAISRNFFLAGDFYLGGRMESATRSAMLVAERVLKEFSGRP